MALDDDDDGDDVEGFARPLPPDDRLWRHPSELSSTPASAPPAVIPPVGAAPRGSTWATAAVAGLVGAALCAGLLAVTGQLDGPAGQRVVQKVALTPVVSSPLMKDDHSVAVLARRLGPTVATLHIDTDAGPTTAAAFVFREDGLLLTSARSVEVAEAVTVVLADGRRFDGEVLGADLPLDVALVAIDAHGLPVAVLGQSADVVVGSPIVALGPPDASGQDPPVATGVISSLQRRLDVAGASLHGLLQTDAPVSLPWSGGPLVDAQGAVIGLTIGLAGESAGFGYATPIDVVRRAAGQLLAAGRVSHAWLGIEGEDVPTADAGTLGIAGGARVRRVISGSPADLGGLATGDVITEVDGVAVSSSSGLVVAMRHQVPGDEVTVAYWRSGTRRETRITCDTQP